MICSSADVQDELRGALHPLGGARKIDAALEAERRVARKRKPPRTARHRGRVEPRRFEENVDGRIGNRACVSAHDAPERERLPFVGDQEDIGGQTDLLPVQQFEPLAVAREPHDYVAVDRTVVESMQRLPELEHDEVGDIDDRGNRTQSAAFQALHHPGGRTRFGIHAADDAAAVARAGRGLLQADVSLVVLRHLRRRHRGFLERCAGQNRDFASDTTQAQAVAAVGRELERDELVVEVEHPPHIGTQRRLGGQREQF